MPAYILRAVSRLSGASSLIDDLNAAVLPGQAPFVTPILADDFSSAWLAFVAAHGKSFNPFSISTSGELELMLEIIADASGGSGHGCLLFGAPNTGKAYSDVELLQLFEQGQIRFSYTAHTSLADALTAATANQPDTVFFGGVTSVEIQAELNLLEEFSNKHFNIH
ncbi:hypothetical protein [Variovorax ginsengisoli]|uniref:Uncharacterized protein n=1 Tax=Variovorax ginsengisoli TaxID=363844 RepID=A0ABT8SBU8_9BURK|nr:hypothetical protein [Variovorax ginsengisoli]MDN8617224.1 hypothetical protein [Variovorax ginsengisoli]MDO1536394.1 hypothetical protein [Variovorax ginsengisoli]